MPAKVETTPALPGLSPAGGKSVIARFNGGHLSADGGRLVLREVEQRLDVAGRLAACIADPRDLDRVVHGLDEIIRFRLLMIAAGYEDGNDADRLRADPMSKLAMERLEDETALCSQPTIWRWRTCPARARCRAWVKPWSTSTARRFARRRAGSCWTWTTRSTPCTAGSKCACSTPTTMNTASSPSWHSTARAASSPPCCVRPNGREVRAFLRRLVRQLRVNWPRVEVLIRADSHYCAPEALRWRRANKVEYLLGVAPTSTLRRNVETLEASTAARFAASGTCAKLRRFTEFHDGAASWDRVERIVARVEAGPDGVDTRFVVTSLPGGSARTLYEKRYCARGQAENHVKSWKHHLAADRTSCIKAAANQIRLFLTGPPTD